MMLDVIFSGKDTFKVPTKVKGPKHSEKYLDKEPFIEGQQYKYGTYVGIFRGCFLFKTHQKDSDGLHMVNFVSRFEEELIESLLANH